MNHAELAAGLGISRSNATKLVARGMPTDSIEAARAWRRANVAFRARGGKQPARARAPAGAVPPPQAVTPVLTAIPLLAELWMADPRVDTLERLREQVLLATAGGVDVELPTAAWDALVGDRL
jgi:hypothetical protein